MKHLLLRRIILQDYHQLWLLRNDVSVRRWLRSMVSFSDFSREVETDYTLVGTVNNDVVGYARLDEINPTTFAVFVCLHSVFRAQGFGKQLLNSTYLWATHNGIQKLVAGIDPRNDAGKALAEACGFVGEGYAPSKGVMKAFYARS